jgi:hypothetical protein
MITQSEQTGPSRIKVWTRVWSIRPVEWKPLIAKPYTEDEFCEWSKNPWIYTPCDKKGVPFQRSVFLGRSLCEYNKNDVEKRYVYHFGENVDIYVKWRSIYDYVQY